LSAALIATSDRGLARLGPRHELESCREIDPQPVKLPFGVPKLSAQIVGLVFCFRSTRELGSPLLAQAVVLSKKSTDICPVAAAVRRTGKMRETVPQPLGESFELVGAHQH
jgi:hypothetical protein